MKASRARGERANSIRPEVSRSRRWAGDKGVWVGGGGGGFWARLSGGGWGGFFLGGRARFLCGGWGREGGGLWWSGGLEGFFLGGEVAFLVGALGDDVGGFVDDDDVGVEVQDADRRISRCGEGFGEDGEAVAGGEAAGVVGGEGVVDEEAAGGDQFF